MKESLLLQPGFPKNIYSQTYSISHACQSHEAELLVHASCILAKEKKRENCRFRPGGVQAAHQRDGRSRAQERDMFFSRTVPDSPNITAQDPENKA